MTNLCSLPVALEIEPLARISASRFLGIKACPLREVWNAAGHAPLLPGWATARLGVIIHRLLEEAASGQLARSESIEARWNDLVQAAEQEMARSPLEQGLLPFKEHIRDFEVRRIRACNQAAEIARESLPQAYFGPRRDAGTAGFEVWVRSTDGMVSGRIDSIIETSDGPVLRDYKSGFVTDRDSENGIEGDVKDDYQFQLKLYAALL